MLDKAITLDSGLLDCCDVYNMIHADKGLEISKECCECFLTLHIPPGKRGVTQMTIQAVNKTKCIANLRILVVHVMRRLKTFHIIQHELSIALVPHAHKILLVCAALSRKP